MDSMPTLFETGSMLTSIMLSVRAAPECVTILETCVGLAVAVIQSHQQDGDAASCRPRVRRRAGFGRLEGHLAPFSGRTTLRLLPLVSAEIGLGCRPGRSFSR